MDTRLSDSFKKKIARLERAKSSVAVKIGNAGTNLFLKAFRDEAWDGVKWPEVKRRIPTEGAYKYPKKKDLGRRKRGILIGYAHSKSKTPHLRQSVSTSLKKATWEEILWMIPQIYAKIHNEGGDAKAWGKYPFKMKKRQYIGFSNTFKRIIANKIQEEFKAILAP